MNNIRRCSSIVLVLLMTFGTLSGIFLSSIADIEPDGDFTTATPLAPEEIAVGTVNSTDTSDFYQFAVTSAQTISVKLENLGGSGNLHLVLYYSDHTKVFTTDNLPVGNSNTYNFTTSQVLAETYYAEVVGSSNSYRITLHLVDQNDAGQGGDASDTELAPTLVPAEKAAKGWICDDDNYDVFGFNIADAKSMRFLFTTEKTMTYALNVQLYSPSKVKLLDTVAGPLDTTTIFDYTTSLGTTGTYFIKVSGTCNSYRFIVYLTAQNDGGKGVDAPDSFPGLSMTAGVHLPGWISDADKVDYYSTVLPKGDILTLNLTVGTTVAKGALDLTLFSATHAKIAETGFIDPGNKHNLTFTGNFESSSVYYFSVSGGPNDYTFNISTKSQNDSGTGTDAPAALSSAINLTTGTYTGWLADIDTADSYNITVAANHTFTVNLSGGPANTPIVMVDFFNETQDKIGHIDSIPGAKATYSLPEKDALAKNTTYYLRVFNGNGSTYRLEVYLPKAAVDKKPPTLRILNPAEGLVTKALKITVHGTAYDAAGTVEKVEYALDNATWISCTGNTSWNCNVTLASGLNKVTVRATDRAGNMGYKDLDLTFDQTAPTLTIEGLADNSTVGKSKLTITGSASDNTALTFVEVRVNGGAWKMATGTTTWSYNATLNKGSNVIDIRVTDKAGNVVEETRTIKYKQPTHGGFIPGFETAILVAASLIAVAMITAQERKR